MEILTEIGHEVNEKNFGRIISCVESFGTKYNPSQSDLKVANLKITRTAMRIKLNSLYAVLKPWVNAVNERVVLFVSLEKLIKRVVTVIEQCDTPEETVLDLKATTSILAGICQILNMELIPTDPTQVNDKSILRIADLQVHYNNCIANFEKLIALLSGEARYKTIDTDLTVSALTSFLSGMKEKNESVMKTYLIVESAVKERDDLFYHNHIKSGAALAVNVRRYVKNVFGGNSPQYKQIYQYKYTILS